MATVKNIGVLTCNSSKITVKTMKSSVRRIKASIARAHTRRTEGTFGRMELDSHADTIVAGANCVVLAYTGRECDVSPYDDKYEPVSGVPIVNAATAWQSPITGQVYILILNESLWMPQLPNTLVNQNQLRYFGTKVQDNPYSDIPMHIRTEDSSFSMKLESQGTTIFANTFAPTDKELDDNPRIVLSSDHAWNPHNVQFPVPRRTLEEEMDEVVEIGAVSVHHKEEFYNPNNIFSISSISRKISSIFDSSGNGDSEHPKENEILEDLPTKNVFSSGGRHADVSEEELSERWFISLKQASKTLRKTTQKFLRSALLPMTRRYRADRHFYRKTLSGS